MKLLAALVVAISATQILVAHPNPWVRWLAFGCMILVAIAIERLPGAGKAIVRPGVCPTCLDSITSIAPGMECTNAAHHAFAKRMVAIFLEKQP